MRVLVIAPHMDDEVLGVGGTIAKHVEERDFVAVCFVANRAYGHEYDASTIEREQNAARQAQRILGYHESRFLNLPDEQLDRGTIDIIVPLERACDELRPEIVYTCHRGDPHQDHQAVFKASMVLFRAISSHGPRRLLCYEVPSSTDQAAPFAELQFMPTTHVYIPPHRLQKKLDALQCYERESRAYPHPRSCDGVLAYARKRGIEVGLEAAEAFMVLRDVVT